MKNTLSNYGRNGRNILLLDYFSSNESVDEHFPDDRFLKYEQVSLEIKLIDEFLSKDYPIYRTLIVFIGQSSLDLKRRIESIQPIFSKYDCRYVHGQRVYEYENIGGSEKCSVRAAIGTINANPYTALKYTHVVVIDDVISSGITLTTFRKHNMWMFQNAELSAHVLVSKQEEIRGIKIASALFVEGTTTPVNTLSTLTENNAVREKYISRYFSSDESIRVTAFFENLKRGCIYSPRVICFDLYNTLVKETGEWEGELSSEDGEFFHSNIKLTLPSYLDYLEKEYKDKYGVTKETLYQFVRDNLMNQKYESFEEMLKILYHNCLPEENCTTRKRDSIANNAEWYWRAGSASVEWINILIPKKLAELKKMGHKLVLITNCTHPAWRNVIGKINLNIFDLCVVSSEVGVSKPEDSIFKIAEEKFPDRSRDKFMMIGDIAKDDLDVPQKRGWDVCLIGDFSLFA